MMDPEMMKGWKTYLSLAGVALIAAILALNGLLGFLSPDVVTTLQWFAGILAAAAGAAARMALQDNTAKTQTAIEEASVAKHYALQAALQRPTETPPEQPRSP